MMGRIILGHGAEALLYLENGKVVKERISKPYRHPDIDNELRKLRTRSEGKLLQKLQGLVPDVFDVDDAKMIISMEHIDGALLRDALDGKNKDEQERLLKSVGSAVGTFHERDIIHGDLTTSNMIERNKTVVFIDFGLGFVSKKPEDKAVDLHVFRQALDSKHFRIADDCFSWFLDGYRTWGGSQEVLVRLGKVEQRGRYKHKSRWEKI
jgi:bifunctional N6-L-threonylcarbamoyladenine synthase / protein kinase Bud32